MANKLYEEESIKDIADAIRYKTGETEEYTVSEMAQKVMQIETEPEPPLLQTKTVNPTITQQTVIADAGYTGLESVIVNEIQTQTKITRQNGEVTPDTGKFLTKVTVDVPVPVYQSKTVTPTKSQQVVQADSNYNALNKVTVNPIPSDYIVPSGNLAITENGTGIDVKDKSTVSVNVPIPTFETEEVTVTPTKLRQVKIPSKDGYSKVTVEAIPSQYIIPSGSQDITQNGTVDVTTLAEVVVNVPQDEPVYETPSISVSDGGLISASANGKTGTKQLTTKSAQTIDPTESVQTAVPVGTFVIGDVKINAIPSSYIGSAIARKSSTDLTVSGATVTVPSGYYSAQATKSVASGTAGTPSATKGTVNNHQVTITPTVTNTTGYITGGTKTGTAVTVKASDLVSGSETKTANGTYDVTNLAELVVNVSGGGGVPVGYSAIDLGEIKITTAFTTSRQTFNHNLGVVPDVIIVMANGNIAQTYSMLIAIGGSKVNYRGGNYLNHMAYHGNSTTTVSWTNANSTSYGVSNFTATTFQLASSSSSYYWRAGTYKYIALKFS